MGPDIRDSSLQLVPNWNAMTIPETTPSPNATPKIFSQNSKNQTIGGAPGCEVHCLQNREPCRQPDGEGWKDDVNEMVKAHCSRERRSAVSSMANSSQRHRLVFREVDDLVGATAHDRLHHVERETLRHLDR